MQLGKSMMKMAIKGDLFSVFGPMFVMFTFLCLV